jgi:hypothetical protein
VIQEELEKGFTFSFSDVILKSVEKVCDEFVVKPMSFMALDYMKKSKKSNIDFVHQFD